MHPEMSGVAPDIGLPTTRYYSFIQHCIVTFYYMLRQPQRGFNVTPDAPARAVSPPLPGLYQRGRTMSSELADRVRERERGRERREGEKIYIHPEFMSSRNCVLSSINLELRKEL